MAGLQAKFGNAQGKVPPANGKGGGQAMLPDRKALDQLTKGNTVQQSLGNYAKLTPSGATAPTSYGNIIAMGQQGASAKPNG